MTEDQYADIVEIAANSSICSYEWESEGGSAPIGFVKGMALAFGRVYCKYKKGDVAAVEMAKAEGDPGLDAVALYHDEFEALDMRNDVPGVDTLRHLFALMMGFGIYESSGQHCDGRDKGVEDEEQDHETAEAGLFQSSFNSLGVHPALAGLYGEYAGRDDFLETFREGVECNACQWENFGDGLGVAFQALTKNCPAFAVEHAAVAIRNQCKDWKAFKEKEAELTADAEALFREVQDYIDAHGIEDI